MRLITVTIGRNVPPSSHLAMWPARQPNPPAQVAMTREHWARFQSRTEGLLSCLPDAQVFGPFHGTGEWEGIEEDSVTFTVLTSHPTIADDPTVADTFGELLGNLASLFDQDAIAWSHGPALLARKA